MKSAFFQKLGCYAAVAAEATGRGVVVGLTAVATGSVAAVKAVGSASSVTGKAFKEEWERQHTPKAVKE